MLCCIFCGSDGARSRAAVESLRSGITDTPMRPANRREQMGSVMYQPNCWISNDEMITATLPRVSARTCKKIPIENKKYTKFECRIVALNTVQLCSDYTFSCYYIYIHNLYHI